jgi:hypothetical protein
MVAGFIVYFLYSYKHSKLHKAEAAAERNVSYNSLQFTDGRAGKITSYRRSERIF